MITILTSIFVLAFYSYNDTCTLYVCESQYIGKVELIRMDLIPDKFATNKHVECKLDHVPWGWPFVLHHVQCHGNMGVAVVTTKVMLKQGTQKLTFNLAVYWLYKHLYNWWPNFVIVFIWKFKGRSEGWPSAKGGWERQNPPLYAFPIMSFYIQTLSSKNQIKLIAFI